MKKTKRRHRGPLRRVDFIGDTKIGPHGGEYKMLTLECGHWQAWSVPQPRPFARVPMLVPQRVRCLCCGLKEPDKYGLETSA